MKISFFVIFFILIFLSCTQNERTPVIPDKQIIDLKGKKRIRIWFCGTPCKVEEAQWIDNDLIFILGLTLDDDLQYPTIWTYEKNSHISRGIRVEHPVKLSQKGYMEEVRLKKIDFNRNCFEDIHLNL